ncbi:MAG: hydroxymethylbilane synthase [Proteobacteria bacterium]|jgi:hydroxymethylbilane synthase|nr:hydroxymethylbilane synthase [Alphaproteobacteria bacterium]NCC03230.1 hydroxymethylbilane synthase [Pseudomonadota bacterium]
MKKIFRLGTRGSPLALIQAQIVRDELYRTYPDLRQEADIEVVPIRTTGDWSPSQREQTFLEMGGNKGLFTKEIEEALLGGMIDFAVHSMKDVSVFVSPELTYAAFLKREDPRDALLSPLAPRLADLPQGARVGTSSLRRKSQILAMRPDLKVTPLRGNVDTRLKKLAAEEADATILAVAGLRRLGRMDAVSSIFEPQEILPAAAQGILGVQIRADAQDLHDFLAPINHVETQACATAERALLRALDGSCRMPIAAYAQIVQGQINLEALVASPDGRQIIRQTAKGNMDHADQIGYDLGIQMKAQLSSDFFLCNAS